MVRPAAASQANDITAAIIISPYEALVGTHKLVTVPYGFKRRVFKVNVPPGIAAGKVLRLRGQGRATANGGRSDLLLKVIIH